MTSVAQAKAGAAAGRYKAVAVRQCAPKRSFAAATPSSVLMMSDRPPGFAMTR